MLYARLIGKFKTDIITDKSLNIYWYLGFIDIFFQMQSLSIVKETLKITVYPFTKTYLKMDRGGNTMKKNLSNITNYTTMSWYFGIQN